MSRKKYNPRKTFSYVGEESPFAQRLSALIAENGLKQREVAEALEVQRQTVSLYTKGQALPDISTLTKITQFFNVSADYLLGITDAPTFDVKKRTVCDYVGLSETSVDKLHELKEEKSKFPCSQILSDIISDSDFDNFIKRVQQFISEDVACKTNFNESSEFQLDEGLLSENEAEMYASNFGKRLISPQDLAHFYRKLSLEMFENIIYDLSNSYGAEEANKPVNFDVEGE